LNKADGSTPKAAQGSGPRRRARERALHALYRAQVTGDALTALASEIQAEERVPEEVRDYAVHLVSLVGQGGEEIDNLLREALTRWSLERLAVIDLCVLRLATAELVYSPGLPVAVILDEAIEIAGKYGSKDSGGFVNGVLDRVAKTCRKEETM